MDENFYKVQLDHGLSFKSDDVFDIEHEAELLYDQYVEVIPKTKIGQGVKLIRCQFIDHKLTDVETLKQFKL